MAPVVNDEYALIHHPSSIIHHPSSIIPLPSYHYRLKALLLPLLVPVAVLGLFDGVTDGDATDGKRGDGLAECLLVQQLLLGIALQSAFGFLECLHTGLGGQCCQQVLSVLCAGLNAHIYLVVLHRIMLKNDAKLQKIGKILRCLRVFPYFCI